MIVKYNSTLASQAIVLICTYFTLINSVPAYAENLGIVGQTYAIQEEDFLSYIENRMLVMKQSGEWQKIQKKIQDHVSQHIDRPTPVTEVTRAAQSRTWNYDPSVTITSDLHDVYGHVFSKAGSRVNPLSMITMHSALAFYDGDDVDQVNWAKMMDHKYSGRLKLILVRGSVSSQEKLLHQPIYFDQQGRLTGRFHIQHVPAVVMQEQSHLKVMEISV